MKKTIAESFTESKKAQTQLRPRMEVPEVNMVRDPLAMLAERIDQVGKNLGEAKIAVDKIHDMELTDNLMLELRGAHADVGELIASLSDLKRSLEAKMANW